MLSFVAEIVTMIFEKLLSEKMLLPGALTLPYVLHEDAGKTVKVPLWASEFIEWAFTAFSLEYSRAGLVRLRVFAGHSIGTQMCAAPNKSHAGVLLGKIVPYLKLVKKIIFYIEK